MPDLVSLSVPPADYAPQAVALPGLTIGPSRASWHTQRQALRQRWLDTLGHGPSVPPLEPQVGEAEDLGEVRRCLLNYQVEDGVRVEAYLLQPAGDGPFPAVLVYHPTNDTSILEPAGLAPPASLQFGLNLARRGYVTLCPRNYLWGYRGLPEKGPHDFDSFRRITEGLLQRWPAWTGMGKMVWDGLRAVDYLLTRPEVDATRLGCVGHSLGAKEVLYSLAFDERLQAGVSNDGGVGLPQSNWDAPWYLGEGIHQRPDLEHHQIVALCAPRALLVLGGGRQPSRAEPGVSPATDNLRTWNYLEAARPAYRLYGASARLGMLLHDRGHCVPPEAEGVLYGWLDEFVKGTGSGPGRR